jgi:hypothetical protein
VDGLRVDECKLGQSYVFSRARFALRGFYLCSAGTNGCSPAAASRLFPLGAPVSGEVAKGAGDRWKTEREWAAQQPMWGRFVRGCLFSVVV